MKTYRVLYNNKDVDLWIDGAVYKFSLNVYPVETYSCLFHHLNTHVVVKVGGLEMQELIIPQNIRTSFTVG